MVWVLSGVFPLTFSSIEGTWCIDTTWYMTNFQGQTSVETNSSEDQAVPMGSPSTSLLSGRHAGHADGRGMTWATSEPKSAVCGASDGFEASDGIRKLSIKSMDWLKGKSTGSHFPLKYGGGPVKFPLNQSIESTIPPIAASVEDISWEDHSCSHISHWIWESSGWCGTHDKLITTYRLGMVFSYYTHLWWYWRLVEVGDFRVYLFVLLMTDPSVAQIWQVLKPSAQAA